MIPESQYLDIFFRQLFCASLVLLNFIGQTMMKSVQFNGELCFNAIKIQNVVATRMLSAKFESGKLPIPQRAPQLFFFLGLFVTESAGDFL